MAYQVLDLLEVHAEGAAQVARPESAKKKKAVELLRVIIHTFVLLRVRAVGTITLDIGMFIHRYLHILTTMGVLIFTMPLDVFALGKMATDHRLRTPIIIQDMALRPLTRLFLLIIIMEAALLNESSLLQMALDQFQQLCLLKKTVSTTKIFILHHLQNLQPPSYPLLLLVMIREMVNEPHHELKLMHRAGIAC